MGGRIGTRASETNDVAATNRSGVSAFNDNTEFTGETADDRESWLIARRQGVGGSDAAAILGVDEYKSELALYAEKVATGAPDDESSEVADWGRLFEPIILREYERRSKRRTVRAGRLLRSKHASHHLITLDGVQLSHAPDFARGAPGVAEVKTTGYGNRYTEDLPVEVQVQIQWELFVTGAKWATCIWLPFPERRLQWLDVAPHPAFQEVLARKVDDFWSRVQRRSPPDPDGSESSRVALNRLYPDATHEVVRLLAAESIADEYERNKAAIELLETRQRLIKNMLGATIKGARYALLDDGRYWGSAFYKPRENRCKHCDGVLSKTDAYRTLTLREPRKKPFDPVQAVYRLPEALEPDLARPLAESLVGSLPPANDDVAPASAGGE